MLGLCALFLVQHVLAGQLPEATFGHASLETAEAPEPTPAPYLAMELLRRASTPTSLCGYVTGNAASARICNNNGFCGVNANLRAFGCCDTALAGGSLTDCHFYTTCLDASKYSASCGAACQSNLLNGWCTRPSYTYCQTYLSSGYTGYDCGSSPGTYNVLPTPTNNNVAVSTTVPPTTSQAVTTTTTTPVVVPSTTRPLSTSNPPFAPSTTSSASSAVVVSNPASTTPLASSASSVVSVSSASSASSAPSSSDNGANLINGASVSQSQLTVGGSGIEYTTVLPTTTNLGRAAKALPVPGFEFALNVLAGVAGAGLLA